MAEGETNVATATADTAATVQTGTAAVKSEAQVVAELTDSLSKVTKRIEDIQSFIGKQSSEIGELRKKTTEAGKTAVEAQPAAPANAPDNRPFFETLSPAEQDSVKTYMKEQIGRLSEDDRKKLSDGMTDAVFNDMAKEIAGKLKKPAYMSELFGSPVKPVTQPAANDEFRNSVRKIFGLSDREANAIPPGGGGSRGITPSSQKPPNAPRKYPDGGILSMVK